LPGGGQSLSVTLQHFAVFPALHPQVKEYILLEHRKVCTTDLEEKKAISAQLSLKSRELFRSGKEYEIMREDISAWGAAMSHELERIT
jgi:hypothetical protein